MINPPGEGEGPAPLVHGDEVLSFNSWRGLGAHRPLGPINRMKLRVYDASSQFRHQKNRARSLEPQVSDLPK